MPNDNIIPFRPRAALTSCVLSDYDDDAPEDETFEDAAPVVGRPYSIDVLDGEGGKSLLDACLPTHIAMAAVTFIMERLALPATAQHRPGGALGAFNATTRRAGHSGANRRARKRL